MQPRNNCKFSVYSLLKNEIKTRRSHVYKNFRISLKICDQPMSLFHIILYLSTVVAANRNSRTTFLNHRSNRMTSFSISIYPTSSNERLQKGKSFFKIQLRKKYMATISSHYSSIIDNIDREEGTRILPIFILIKR